FRVADYVISTNESYKRIAMSRGGVPEERVTVVRNGPDPSRLQLQAPVGSWRRGRKHLVAFLGEIGEQDGVDCLLRAAHAITRTVGRTDIQFVIMGGGPHYDPIVRYAAELGLSEFVTFTGR